MRAVRPALAALIGVAAVLFTAAPALAASDVRMRLSASHGTADASVTATLSYPTSWGWFGPACSDPVTFWWDGRAIARAHPGRSGGGSCFASVTITPPADASGSHVVNGSARDVGSAEATYTIDAVPVATRSAPPSPPPAAPTSAQLTGTPQRPQPSQPGRSAQSSPSARTTPSTGPPSPAAATAPDPSGSAAPGAPAAPVAMDAPVVVVRPAASTPLGVWVLMAGGALILLGAVLVGAVRLLRREKRWAFSV